LLIGATSASDGQSKLELVGASPVGLKIISSAGNGNNTFLSIQSSKEWRFLTNRGDLIGGNQGDLIIRNNTDSINHIILNQGGSTTFAGSITANGDIIAGNGSGSVSMAINRGASSNSNGLRFRTAGTNNWYIGSGATGTNTDLEIYNHNTATTNLRFNYSTAAATFSSSVTATQMYLPSNAGSSGFLQFNYSSASANSRSWRIYNDTVAYGDLSIAQSTTQTGSSFNYLVTINPSGNVGIGTTAPSEKLHVAGNAYISGVGSILYFDTDASSKTISQFVTNLYEFHILNGRGNSARFVLGNGSISLGTSATPQFFINTGTGNVGIGTTTPTDYSSFTTLHINGKAGSGGGVLRLTAFDNSSSVNIYAGSSAINFNTTTAVPYRFLTRDTVRMQILDSGAVISGHQLGNQYSMTSGGGTGTAIVDTGITYNSGDYGGYGRGFTYKVVFNGNPNGNGSAAYFAQYMGILMVYTGWSGSAVTTYIQYTQLAGGNNIGALTLTPVFWNGSTESSSIGVYTTGAQIRLKISGYNSSATGQDQSLYLTRIS